MLAVMYTWNPQDYAKHSHGQESWARELLTLVELRPDDVVLDVGCGDGRITVEIAKMTPRGRVVGVDLSPDMVAHAAAQHCRPPIDNLRFQRADAAALAFEPEFSVVFSNAALHWVQDQRAAVQGIARALRPGGRFIAQFGGYGNVADVIAVFEHVSGGMHWARRMRRAGETERPNPGPSASAPGARNGRAIITPGESPYRFNTPASYESWLGEAGLEIQECRLIPKDMVHDDAATFVGWLRTAWHPYTSGVPLELRDTFLDETARHYLAGHPPDHHGRVHVATVRLQVRARKPL